MNKELLKDLGIDENTGLKAILEELESKQFECLERLETVSDEKRREELELLLSKIDKEIAETKEQIKTLKSGIILDQGVSEEEEIVPAQTKESKKETKPKESAEDVQKKVEALKAKEADTQAKEAERQQKAAEKAARDAQASVGLNPNQTTSSNNSSSSNAGSNVNPALTNALMDYKNGDYAKAFEGFRKLAEANDVTAQYMLANMYNRGEGTQKDAERAEYWMQRSADGGYVSAQLDYGILKLANSDNVKGLRYLGMAADQDDKQAKLKYIEIVRKEKDRHTRRVCEIAIRYCIELANEETDSYDKKCYNEARRDLEISMKTSIRKDKKEKIFALFNVIGSILMILGGLYLLGGVQSICRVDNKLLAVLPDVPGFLLLPLNKIDILWPLDIMDRNGIFGLELVPIGGMLVTSEYIGDNKKIAMFMKILSTFACIAIAVWSFVILINKAPSFIFLLIPWILVIAISYFVVKVIGAFIYCFLDWFLNLFLDMFHM